MPLFVNVPEPVCIDSRHGLHFVSGHSLHFWQKRTKKTAVAANDSRGKQQNKRRRARARSRKGQNIGHVHDKKSHPLENWVVSKPWVA